MYVWRHRWNNQRNSVPQPAKPWQASRFKSLKWATRKVWPNVGGSFMRVFILSLVVLTNIDQKGTSQAEREEEEAKKSEVKRSEVK
jgi:hypothetical protein